MTPEGNQEFMEAPRIDPSCSEAILVLFRLYLLPKGRAGVGRLFLQVLLLNSVSEPGDIAVCFHRQISQWAKQEAGTCQLYKRLFEWH